MLRFPQRGGSRCWTVEFDLLGTNWTPPSEEEVAVPAAQISIARRPHGEAPHGRVFAPRAGDVAVQHAEAGEPDRLSSFHIWGFIGAPGVSRSTREDQHLFVNRRPVENRGLNFALLEGYHTALMKGRYPVCCLFLEIDPS